MAQQRNRTYLIDTIERFPTYALPCLMQGDCEGLEYNEANAVAEIRHKYAEGHERVSYDPDAASIAFTNNPAFGLPCEAITVNVWGRARDAVLEP